MQVYLLVLVTESWFAPLMATGRRSKNFVYIVNYIMLTIQGTNWELELRMHFDKSCPTLNLFMQHFFMLVCQEFCSKRMQPLVVVRATACQGYKWHLLSRNMFPNPNQAMPSSKAKQKVTIFCCHVFRCNQGNQQNEVHDRESIQNNCW